MTILANQLADNRREQLYLAAISCSLILILRFAEREVNRTRSVVVVVVANLRAAIYTSNKEAARASGRQHVEPNELLSTVKQRGGRRRAVRFRNIYFPLTAGESLPGRPWHGEQVDPRVCLLNSLARHPRDIAPASE